jgi:hypothetical protein
MPLLESLVIELGTTAAKSILQLWLKDSDQKLANAKKEYQETPKDLGSPIEKQREKLLEILSKLQTQVMIYISSQTVLLKLLPLILSKTAEVYEAQTEQDLKLIELSLGQITGAVKQYQNLANRRVIARWLAVLVSILALIGLGGLLFWGSLSGGPSVDTILPIIQVPLPVLLWSGVGSFAAILYRFNNSGDIELQDPLRWLFTRPLTGIVMGIVAYFIVLIGLLSIDSKNIPSIGTKEMLWLVAFISGFSDRFADGLLKLLVGRFGGNSDSQLITFDEMPVSANLSSLVEGLPILKEWLEKPSNALQENLLHDANTPSPSMKEASATSEESKPKDNEQA